MSNIEHYFENMLFYGEDTTGNPNKNALTKEEQNAVEECASYVLYTLFYGRAHLTEFALGNIYGQDDVAEEIIKAANKACANCQEFVCDECEYRHWRTRCNYEAD